MVKKTIQNAVIFVLLLPASAFAQSIATGTVTNLFISATYGDLVYIEVSGAKSGAPACSTKTPWQFVLPRANQFYADLFGLLLAAYEKGGTVTITGSGNCDFDRALETIGDVTY